MAKRNRNTTISSIQRRIDEGRGTGIGASYLPWVQVQDVPSTGLASRIKGWKCDRIHHFISQHESNMFYNLEWSPKVCDIREQYPLLPLEETLSIAEKIGVKHPTDPKTQESSVMSTDFLITVRKGIGTIEIARTVKQSSELASERVLEKFDIERLYWGARGIDWGIVTEREIDAVLAKNVEWVVGAYDLGDFPELNALHLAQVEQVLLAAISPGVPLALSTSQCDKQLGLAPGTSLTAARHLIARRKWLVDMHTPLEPSKPVPLLNQPDINVREGKQLE